MTEMRLPSTDQLCVRLDTLHNYCQDHGAVAWQKEQLAALQRLVPGVLASASSFGMQVVAKAAHDLANRLTNLLAADCAIGGAEWQGFDLALTHLDQVARRQLHSANHGQLLPAADYAAAHLPLIFLLENDPQQIGRLSQVLHDDGYRVRLFTDLGAFQEACTDTQVERPAAVVMALQLPGKGLLTAELISDLGIGKQMGVPVIATSTADDLSLRLAALRARVCHYLVKPVDTGRLLELLEGLTGRQPAEPYRVLLVSDAATPLQDEAEVLRDTGMVVRVLSEPLKVLEAVDEIKPDVVVLDVFMTDATGPELAAILRERDVQEQLPILFLSADSDTMQQLLAFNPGGDECLLKPVRPSRLVATVRSRAWRARHNNVIWQRLKADLYEREREHQALDHHAIVSIADKHGDITYINDRFCQISGYSREELIGHNHRIVKSGEHSSEFYRDMWHAISRGEIWQGEICNRRKNGELYWVESTITPFLDDKGSVYQYVSIRTDISHMKLAEAAVRQSEARLSFLVSSSPVTIYTAEVVPPYGFTYISPNMHKLMGFEPSRFTEDSRFWLDNLHPNDRQQTYDQLAALFESGDEQLAFEYRFRHQDGGYRWIHDELRLIRDDGGQPIEIVGYWLDITDRKRAEEAAQAHKERLRRGQLYANIGTWDWNVQSGDLYWTERIAPLFGYAEGELETSYANFLAAVHPDDRQAVIDAVNACVEHDAPYDIEHRVVWPDGTVRWLLERGAVLRDADGKPLQMVGVVQDIDDRKRAELSLAEHERQLREAQILARLGNWHADMRSGELTWSDEIYRIFGYDPASFEPSVEAFVSAVHPDDRALVRDSEKRAERTGRHDVVHRIVRPDGTVRHVHELAQAETDESGDLIRLQGTVQDITERILAEQALQESQAKLSGLFTLSPLGIALTDMDGRYLEFNEAFRAISGYPADELKSLDYWTLTPGEYEEQEAKQLALLKTTGCYGPYEKAYRRKDGSLVPIRLNGMLVKQQGGRNLIWSIVEDITDSKHAEQALIAARDEAERANRAKSEFLSSMSHELRTPMNAILGFGQLMAYDNALPVDHQDNVQEILKAGNHLLDLINDVLDLAKVESGRIDLSLEQVDVNTVVDECMKLVATLAAKQDIRLTHAGLPGAQVQADRMRLKQVLLNLLSNAIKYNRDGGLVNVNVDQVDADQLQIQVTDTGSGIAPEHLDELFKPFNRLDAENSEIEGTGIGLTITRRIVVMMGGKLTVQSRPGHGSTFTIELPQQSAVDSDSEEHQDLAVVESGDRARQAHSQQYLVLYIEDNPANLKLVAQLLGRKTSSRLLTAHNPELGIELALANRPDLILLDINMPGMDGYQVLEVFRAADRLYDIPVVAISANAMPIDVERGMAAGFTDYLTKPINVSRFFTMLERFLPGQVQPRG